MFVGTKLKSYYMVAGGDQPGKRVKEAGASTPLPVATGGSVTSLSPLARPVPGAPLDGVLALGSVLGSGTLDKRARRSRSVGDLASCARLYSKRRGCGPGCTPGVVGLVGGMGRGWRAGAGGTRGPVADADSADTDSAARPGPEGRRLATPASGALRACLLLMLNAWRVRREEARVLRQRVDQMRLQVTTLRSLNKQETERASRALGETRKAQAQGDALRLQLDAARSDAEGLAAASATLEARLAEQLTAAENLRNELQAARQDAAALDAQLAKERAKLAAVREERAQLREQVEEKAIQLSEAEDLLEQARSDCEQARHSAEEGRQELTALSARCKALEDALASEQQMAMQAQETIKEHAQELDLIRAQLEVERSPRRSVCRLLEILRVPFGLLHAVYLAVCPYTTPPSRPH